MKYVCLLQSISHPTQRYVGITTDIQQRLIIHNQSGSPHTSEYKPWRIVTALRFDDEHRASAFERYLKTGSAGHLQTSIRGNTGLRKPRSWRRVCGASSIRVYPSSYFLYDYNFLIQQRVHSVTT
jgi:putative endonuclease